MEQHSPRPPQSDFWLVRFRGPIFFFLIVLSFAGIYAAQQVPISVFPDTNFPRVVIGVDNGVMPVEQMQVTITKPIEDAVNSVPGLTTVRSNTSRGSAEVSLFFDWSVDMFRTLELVNSALSRVQQELPPTAKITTNRLTFATFPILGYSLTTTNNSVTQSDLWELATYTLKPPLNRVDGVATVTIQGGQVPEYHVEPNLARLQASGVTVLDLANAIGAANTIDSPGLYPQNHQLVLALVGSQAHDMQSLRELTVKTTASGAPVRVSDLAEVIQAPLPVYTYVSANGHPAVLLNIARQPSSNTVQVANNVAAAVQQLRSRLPRGVVLEPFYDQSQIVRESIASVRDAILIGLLLACVILYLFLRDWRSSLIAGMVIPVTVAVTVLVLWLAGKSFNPMTLGGVAAAGENRLEAVRKALREISRPLIGSTIPPVVVFLPLIAVTGVTGSFFRALAITMAVSLLTSLALAVTWTPGLAMVLLKSRKREDGEPIETPTDAHHEQGPMMRRLTGWQHSALDWSLRRPLWLGVACVALAAVAYFAYSNLGTDLLPEMDEGGFILDYVMPAGSSLESTGKVLDHVERILRATPEVDATSRRTGLQMGFAAVTEANTGDITVRLKNNRHRAIDEVIADVRQQVKTTEPELDVEFTQVLQDNIGDLSNAPEPIQIKLFNPDPALLQNIAPRVATEIAKVSGVVDIENGIDNTVSGPATNFQVNPQTSTRLGFTTQEVAEDATSILDGVEVANPLIANGRPYTIRVRLGDATRASLDAIEGTVFNSATGHTAPLGSMTTITQLPPQNEIRRENLQRLAVVTARLEGTDLGTAVKA